jgi:hypothetical protein
MTPYSFFGSRSFSSALQGYDTSKKSAIGFVQGKYMAAKGGKTVYSPQTYTATPPGE